MVVTAENSHATIVDMKSKLRDLGNAVKRAIWVRIMGSV